MNAYHYARINPVRRRTSRSSTSSRPVGLCQEHGWLVCGEHYDHLASGRSLRERPQFNAALEAACANRGFLVTYSLSRVSRSVVDVLRICESVSKADPAILACDMPMLDTSTPLGRLFVTQLTVLNQYVREQNAHVTSEAMRYHLANPNGSRVRLVTIVRPACPVDEFSGLAVSDGAGTCLS